MKKIMALLLVVLSVAAAGCFGSSKKPFELIDISMSELDQKMEEGNTFVLLVEREGCAFCKAMNEYMDQTSQEHPDTVVYHLDTTDYELYREEPEALTLASSTEDGKRLLEIFPYFLYTPALYSFEDGKPIRGAFGYDEEKNTVSLWNLDSSIDWNSAQAVPVWSFIDSAQPGDSAKSRQ